MVESTTNIFNKKDALKIALVLFVEKILMGQNYRKKSLLGCLDCGEYGKV